MENEINLIIEKVLIECKNTISELQNSANVKDVNFYGHSPIEAIVKYHDRFNESKICFGEVLKAWKIGIEEIKPIQDLNIENIKEPIDRMYNKQGIFLFAMDLKKKKVIITWQVGPRFGRGILYSIKQNEKDYWIQWERVLWVS